jgi:kinesin family protein 6/9
MTTILKDSLGGNCRTVMIATVSMELDNLDETISTLRFSQRVGQLENEVVRNEKSTLMMKVEMLENTNAELLARLEKSEAIIK